MEHKANGELQSTFLRAIVTSDSELETGLSPNTYSKLARLE
jgi:hypothetical protein